MLLKHGLHLAYCTNIHRSETWAETFAALEQSTLRVKARVQPRGRYAIGLRLSDRAAQELSDPAALLGFQRWLDRHDAYVFTINGFPFGQFHDVRVKENVYRPDWTDARRVAYTERLFRLLAQLLPPEVEGSVSTSPGTHKDFITRPEQAEQMRANFWRLVEFLDELSGKSNRLLHLGVEPEPFGGFENTAETVQFFERMREAHPGDARLERHLGVNYDACHLAVEFEEPAAAMAEFQRHGIRISKLHLSSALRLRPTPAALQLLARFDEPVYLHQVIVRQADGRLVKFRDLAPALQSAARTARPPDEEWRVHFHVPLHWQPTGPLQSTVDQVRGLLPLLQAQPQLCSHLEMETYTWAVLPEFLHSAEVVDQLVGEYEWVLRELAHWGLC